MSDRSDEETEGIPRRIPLDHSNPVVRILYPSYISCERGGKEIIDIYLGLPRLSGKDIPPLSLKYYFPAYQLELSKLKERLEIPDDPEKRPPTREELLEKIYNYFNGGENPLLKPAHQKRIMKYQGHTNFTNGDVIMIGDLMYQLEENGFRIREGDVRLI